jgi:hypothetical protein
MNKTVLILFIVSVFFYCSCKKESTNNNIKDVNTTTSDSFFPIGTGSTWSYYLISDGLASDIAVIKISDTNTTINSRSYHKASYMTKLYGDTTEYFYAGDHLFALKFTDLLYQTTFDLQILNDTASVGYKWTAEATDNNLLNNIPVRAVTTILEKNISKSVGGATFKNVTHTQVEIQYVLNGQAIEYATYDFYFAKGVGIIESDYDETNVHHRYYTIQNYEVN